MGYCIYIEEIDVSFPVKNAERILQAIKNLHGKETIADGKQLKNGKWSDHYFSWVNEDFYKINDIKKMFEEWGWTIEKSRGEYKITELLREKIGDDDIFFKAIAPFMNDGFINVRGEDGNVWKWVFENGHFEEKEGRIEYDDPYEIFMSVYKKELTPELKKQLKEWRVLRKL